MAWHIVRLDGARPVKKVQESKPGERKKKGNLTKDEWTIVSRTWGIRVYKNGEQDLWTRRNGHLQWRQRTTISKYYSTKEKEKEEREEEAIHFNLSYTFMACAVTLLAAAFVMRLKKKKHNCKIFWLLEV